MRHETLRIHPGGRTRFSSFAWRGLAVPDRSGVVYGCIVMSIHKKLIEFHQAFRGVKKSGFNPHFRSEYMTLEDVINGTTPVLNNLGLYITHHIAPSEDGAFLVTRLCAEDGETLEPSLFPLSLTSNPQATASQITYGKRYNITNLLNIAEADDDGNAAQAEATKLAGEDQKAQLRMLADGNDKREAYIYAEDKDGTPYLELIAHDAATTLIERWSR